jgi:diguanylate cyclase (GGDEF)-like protein/PAS domain S-box-containing protein
MSNGPGSAFRLAGTVAVRSRRSVARTGDGGQHGAPGVGFGHGTPSGRLASAVPAAPLLGLEVMVGIPVDPANLLAACVAAADTAISVADATDPDLPLVYVNPAFERLTGYGTAESLGRNARFMQGPDSDPDVVRAIGRSLREGRFTRARLVNYRANGTAFWVDLHISPIRDASGAVVQFFAVQHDVTTEVFGHERAVQAATLDALTGLMNRARFGAELQRELARATRNGTSVGVLFFDVDDFKDVNDAHGHVVGDGFLVHVAESLRQRLRGQDAAARIGGDEFIAFISDLPGDGVAGSAAVVADLMDALSRPFWIDGIEHSTSVSIGTALFPRDGQTVRELVARADADMYRRKPPRAGRPPTV